MARTWNEVAAAGNRSYRKVFKKEFKDPLRDIYNSNLPGLLKDVFVEAYVIGVDRSDEDMVILIEAWKQIQEKGYI